MLAQQHVDNLAVLIDGTERIPPVAADLEQRVVDPPLPSDRAAVSTCRLDEARREGVHPVVDRAWIDRDAPLSQPLRHLGLPEAEAQVPADSQRDDLVREAVAAEGRS
jgi:hypothetical protein